MTAARIISAIPAADAPGPVIQLAATGWTGSVGGVGLVGVAVPVGDGLGSVGSGEGVGVAVCVGSRRGRVVMTPSLSSEPSLLSDSSLYGLAVLSETFELPWKDAAQHELALSLLPAELRGKL